MINIESAVRKTMSEGYRETDAIAKVCQDIVLCAISRSSLDLNITVKGGVVMRDLSASARRATQDIDLDFIKYSIDDESIKKFVTLLNDIEGLQIELYGNIEELNQQDYHGKRIYLKITDSFNYEITTKVDLGVHNHIDIYQEEYCFDVSIQENGVSLLINSKEQIFTEKLCSLLKFGSRSTRYKDIFDLFWLSDKLDESKLQECFQSFIFENPTMKETNISEITNRIRKTLTNTEFRKNMSGSKKNWLNTDDDEACEGLLNYLSSLDSIPKSEI